MFTTDKFFSLTKSLGPRAFFNELFGFFKPIFCFFHVLSTTYEKSEKKWKC